MTDQYIVVIVDEEGGTLGFHHYGPFATYDAAVEYMDMSGFETWFVSTLKQPVSMFD